jgi:hypothetical protein
MLMPLCCIKIGVYYAGLKLYTVGQKSLTNFTIQLKIVTYLDILQQFVVPQVKDLQPTIIFQQEGALQHWGRIVRDYLDATFLNRWLGRDGPFAWPPQSLDITPLDVFLWGYVKDKVYATKGTGVEDLKTRIRMSSQQSIEACWLTHGKNWNFD